MESTRLTSFSCTAGLEHLLQGQADTMDQLAPSEAGTSEETNKMSLKWRFGAFLTFHSKTDFFSIQHCLKSTCMQRMLKHLEVSSRYKNR